MRKLLLLILVSAAAHADEGMWTLDNLPQAKLKADYNFSADQAWADKMMRGSARIAGGCSASFVSASGLVMTNHHCAVECVEQLSTAAHDKVAEGFLARRHEDEIRCPEIELNRLEAITDVTEQVKAATQGLSGAAFKSAQNAINAKLASACVGDDKAHRRCDVVDLYHGGRYHLYRYRRFQDTRLVWAPEQAVAFFGGDPDNFNFPRYDLDISLLRVYEDDKPAKIDQFFRFSANGAADGELVFVTGHPGRTERQLTVAQLDTERNLQLIRSLLRLAELRGVLTQYGNLGAEQARVAKTDLFYTENSYKALNGRLEALLDPLLMQQKQADETELRQFVAAHPELPLDTAQAWDAIAKGQASYRDIYYDLLVKERAAGFRSKYFEYARTLVRGSAEKALANGERLPEFADAKLPEVEQRLFSTAPIYPDFERLKLAWSLTKMREWLGADDAFVKQVLGRDSPERLVARMVAETRLGDPAVRKSLWTGGANAIAQSTDPFIKLALAIDPAARAIRKQYERDVETVVQRNSELIAKARFAKDGLGAYPDATFTLRLSYGKVQGWNEAGRTVAPFTDLDGAFARDTGFDPFALPASWHAAKPRLNLAQRFNFVTTNDIIGGNSGSPMLNAKGEIVGLIFDGNIHSLGGEYGYDPRLNRAVAVHSGGILELLGKVYQAPQLVDELTSGSPR